VRKIGDKVCDVCDVLAMPAGVVHSVVNETDRTTLSFHVYGKHFNHPKRSQYDPDKRIEMPFKVATR
jgi:predicted metal-dependent enzyme (double-stranded beta helix superfamily)